MRSAIRAEGLSKLFGRLEALAPLDLEVEAGEVLGYLDPNGAGKTTTIRLLLGCCDRRPARPRSSVWTCGATPWRPTAGSPTSRARPACSPR
jgi:ABC-2 type transport system ATP-binding protein